MPFAVAYRLLTPHPRRQSTCVASMAGMPGRRARPVRGQRELDDEWTRRGITAMPGLWGEDQRFRIDVAICVPILRRYRQG
jgi:hypothetical protein